MLHKYMPGGMKTIRLAPMSLNDVCVYIPAWFGSLATFGVFMLTMVSTLTTLYPRPQGCVGA